LPSPTAARMKPVGLFPLRKGSFAMPLKLDRRQFAALALGAAASVGVAHPAGADSDPLPSWNDGPAKEAILTFVRATTESSSANIVPPEQRIATFDQDGTLWVEHPIYTQVVYCFDRVPAVVKAKPDLADKEPFKTVLSGNREAIAKLSMDDLLKIAAATLTGMDVEAFRDEAAAWIAAARDPRWERPYTDLTYLPQIELLNTLRGAGYETYIVTGGGQDFVRAYAERVYGIPPEKVVGSAGGLSYEYAADGRPVLIKEPKLILNDNNAGKPESIHLMIGRRPYFAIGNSTGDRQMCEYTKAATAPGSRCWCCTTTTSANTPTGLRKACPTRRSGPSPRNSTTRRRGTVGSSSA
jgi:phosphoglycolate phosphatase-like HAD superfamily hydrolase